MSDSQLRVLLERLRRELENTDEVDPGTLEEVRKLDADIHRLVDSGGKDQEVDTVLDRAASIETRFAVDHPVAERFIREIMDTLAKLGI
jgi:hypothetical protein